MSINAIAQSSISITYDNGINVVIDRRIQGLAEDCNLEVTGSGVMMEFPFTRDYSFEGKPHNISMFLNSVNEDSTLETLVNKHENQ